MNIGKPHKHNPEEPLSFNELQQDIEERIERISDEFKNGFNLLKNCEKSVTFFGSARTSPEDEDFIQAKDLAKKISEETGYSVVTGGGPGIMEAANCGAAEANGGSIGLTIKLPKEQITNSCIENHMDFRYFFARKVCLSYAAEAYIYFPGGFGTMDELFEILTLVQTKKIAPVPIILVGKEYWEKFDSFIKDSLLREGKIDQIDTELYKITDSDEEIIEIIKNAPVRKFTD